VTSLEADPGRGRVVRALGWGGAARLIAVTAETPAGELCRRHGLTGPAARLAVEAMVANALLSAHIKGDERILLEVSGRTPRFTYSGEVSARGDVRARFSPSLLAPDDHLAGTLIAIKWDATREVYRGVAPLEHASFEEALQDFMVRSQQTRGLVRLRCEQSADGEIACAIGALIELMPGEEADLTAVAAAPVEALVEGLRGDLSGPAAEVLGEPVAILGVSALRYRCTCSLERVESTLVAMGAAELRSLLEEQGGAEVTCHFCNTRYALDAAALDALIARIS
jgi:molecular chaperone Hsp33